MIDMRMLRSIKEFVWKKERTGRRRTVTILGWKFFYTRKIAKNKRGIDPRSLDPALREFSGSGLSSSERKPKLIVSLTSFPQRMYLLHYTIYSLLKQSVKPDMLLLWLAEEQFPNKEQDIPQALLNLKKNGLSIRWCRDMRSYKKIIPALREYPDDIIVTADDDCFYAEDWLEKLWNAWRADPQSIHCHRATRGVLTARKTITRRRNWKRNPGDAPSFWNFATGSYGILYGPHTLHPDVLNEDLFLRLSPTVDDFWLWAMAVLQGTRIHMLDDNNQPGIYIDPETNEELLELGPCLNKEYGNNGPSGKYQANILSAYPQLIEILESER